MISSSSRDSLLLSGGITPLLVFLRDCLKWHIAPAENVAKLLRVTRSIIKVDTSVSLVDLQHLLIHVVEGINRHLLLLHEDKHLFACAICMKLLRVEQLVEDTT